MKRLVPILVLLLAVAIALGIGWSRFSRQLLDSFLAEWSTQGMEIELGHIDYLWPMGLRIHDVALHGEEFILEIPVITARLPLSELLNRRREVDLVAETVTLVSSSLSFWDVLPHLALREVPDCRLTVTHLTLSGTDLLTDPFGLELVKRDAVLFFRILDTPFALNGRLEEKDSFLLSVAFGQDRQERMEVMWNLAEGRIQGVYENEHRIVFHAGLESTVNGAMYFTDLEVHEEGDSGFCFRGEGAFNPALVSNMALQGEIHLDGAAGMLTLEANITANRHVEGIFSLDADSFDLALQGDFLFALEDSHLQGNILPGSSMGATEFQAVWEVIRVGGANRLFFHTPALFFSFPEHIPHASFFGEVEGWFEFSSGIPTGKFDFLGEFIEFREYNVLHPRLSIHLLPGGRIELTGQGEFLQSVLDVKGVWDGSALALEGEVRQLPVNELLEQTLPVSGLVSGNLVLTAGRDSPARIGMELTEGNIFWEHSQLGNVQAGKITLEADVVHLEGLILEQGGGKLFADIESGEKGVFGAIRADGFPLTYHLEDLEIELFLNGETVFAHNPEGWEAGVQLESPHWRAGAFTGEELVFRGWLRGDTVEVEHFSTVFPEGSVELSGRATPFHSLDVQGVLTSLVLPADTDFAYRGEVEELSFTAAGPWEEVEFSFHGEGRDFFLGDRLLGEYFRISLGGRTALPGPGEDFDLVRYLGPEVLEHGEISLLGVNLAELGLAELNEYGISATCDLYGHLDWADGRWSFMTENLRGKWEDQMYFSGELAFEYRDDVFFIADFSLFEERGMLSVGGNGWIDPATGNVDIDLQIISSGRLPLPPSMWEGELLAVGKAELNIRGNSSNPQMDGMVILERLVLMKEKETIFTVKNMVGFITEEPSLFLQEGEGTLAGFDFTCSGELDAQGADITLTLRGQEGLFGTGETFQGRWEGKLKISGPWSALEGKGEIKLFDGLIDTSLLSEEADSSEIFRGIEKTLKEFPFPLKLSLLVADTLHVKTQFLEISLEGGVEITAEEGNLEANGRLDVIRGVYNLVLNQIDVEGYVLFGSFFGLEPQLDLEGRKRIGRYRVTLRARGPLDNYEMTLESHPSLSQEEIVSLLLLGSPEAYTSLDRIDLQGPLVKVAQFLLGIDGKDFERNIFFDGIEVTVPGQNPSGLYGVKFSKDLGENLSVSYTQDLGGEGKSSLGFELDFSREWSFRTEIQRDGRVEWELEYHTRF